MIMLTYVRKVRSKIQLRLLHRPIVKMWKGSVVRKSEDKWPKNCEYTERRIRRRRRWKMILRPAVATKLCKSYRKKE
jgi:hypothetical protein